MQKISYIIKIYPIINIIVHFLLTFKTHVLLPHTTSDDTAVEVSANRVGDHSHYGVSAEGVVVDVVVVVDHRANYR